ncbi:MAG: cyclic lactone autoinducer peptide [Erysipelotrichaceae bacterium]|jgi:cyclic lactone autoinducer peptide|nr:cyclic lactone autoinducer peptide [Erysipelotrichaceae bacterium]
MKKINVLEVIAKASHKAAVNSVNTASNYDMHQVKAPKELEKYKK